MPLVVNTLESALKADILGIESDLQKSLDDHSNGIYSALQKIDSEAEGLAKSGFNIDSFKKKQWGVVSQAWSTALAKQIVATLSDKLSTIIATEVDKYIKSASIIVPPGQIVATAGSPTAQTGATTAPSPPALIS